MYFYLIILFIIFMMILLLFLWYYLYFGPDFTEESQPSIHKIPEQIRITINIVILLFYVIWK